MAHFVRKIAILILLIGVVKSSVVNYLNPVTDPCYGAGNGKVRALTVDSLLGDCGEYVQCINDQSAEFRTCEYENPYFDAETGECVNQAKVCFRCPKTKYELISVPHVCRQFILCYNNKPLLLECPDKLVFDGSPGVHQCNYAPDNDCFREDKDDFESKPCPSVVGKEPQYEVIDTKPGIYYVCFGQPKPLRLECPGSFIFNKDKGVCERW